MMNQMDTSALCRPVVYITVRDPLCRARISDVLARDGWTVVEQPTGFHLIQAIANVIDGHPWRAPALIVVDALAPGCRGTTIAAGLRDLGVAIPVVVIRDPMTALDEVLRVAGSITQEYAGRYVSGASPGLPESMRRAG
jgi:DNA-binding response OmpR family regulator